MTKFNFAALLIIACAVAGGVVGSLTPFQVLQNSEYVDSNNYSDLVVKVFLFGNGDYFLDLRVFGVDLGGEETLEMSDWVDVFGEEFPIVTPILVMTGLGLALIGGILFLFNQRGVNILAMIFGIAGGALAIVGPMLYLNFGSAIGEGLDKAPYHIGFYACIAAGVLVALFSVAAIFIGRSDRPRKRR